MDTGIRGESAHSDLVAFHRRLNWSAIVAAVVATLGLWIMLLYFGGALGLSTFNPARIAEQGSEARPATAIAWLVVSAVGSFFFGSWIAGHWANVPEAEDAYMQGVATWGLATLLIAFGFGSLVGLAQVGTGATALPAAAEGRNANTPLAYNSLNDPQFVQFVDSRLKEWAPKNAPQAVNVTANQGDQNKSGNENKGTSSKDISSNDELISFVMASADLNKEQAKNFLTSEKDSLAKEMSDSAKRWEQQHSRDLAIAERDRKIAATAGWTMTGIAFLTLCAAVGGSFLGWKQATAMEELDRTTARNV